MNKELINYIKLLLSKYTSMSLADFVIKAYLKIIKIIRMRIAGFFYKNYDFRKNQISNIELDFGKTSFENFDLNLSASKKLEFLQRSWMTGFYDFLGSGPVNVNLDKNDQLNLLSAHAPYSSMVRQQLSDGYLLKRWNEDFKSGHSWSNTILSFKCTYGDKDGVDIKLPWEFSRLQHLPQMAIYAISDECRNQEELSQEIIDQILDFWSSNPLYMGPNWICAMDVGIRAVNILMALQILTSRFPDLITTKQRSLISQSIYHHGKFIVENLEYSAELTSNH